MTTKAVIEKLKSAFTCHDQELEYSEEEFRFVWRGNSTARLPRESGVYCLFSHNGSRIQKSERPSQQAAYEIGSAGTRARKLQRK